MQQMQRIYNYFSQHFSTVFYIWAKIFVRHVWGGGNVQVSTRLESPLQIKLEFKVLTSQEDYQSSGKFGFGMH